MKLAPRAAALALALAAAPTALAQQYPAKPIRVIVPTVPGPLDVFARYTTEKMSERLKQPFVVENRPGAGGNIGVDLVAKAPPDGYTITFAIDTTYTVNPAMYKKLPFDPDKDFATISMPVTYSQLLAVHPSVSANNVQELVALAKQSRKLAYATGGTGTPSHLTMALFLATAGIDMTHIPYKGTGQSVVDVVGGQVETIFAVVSGVLPQVRAGKLRPLAVSSPQRSALAPEIPTIAESGYRGFNAQFGFAVMAPAGTSEDIVQLLNRELRTALAHPDVVTRLRAADFVPTDFDPAKSAAHLRAERERWTRVVRQANITVDQ
jgi:tripartite-type tricarboxylate transporter receptor subunit TctC